MQMLIDIDEETVNTIEKIKFLVGGRTDRKLQLDIIKAIKNGIPIPKGHGDLIDRSKNCIACKYDETEDENGEHCSKCLGGNSQFEVDTEFINKCKAEDCISRQAVDDILTLYSDGNGLMDARGAVTMVRELPSVTPKKEEFEWCDTCKEYDQEKHCCHRWSKVIRDTVEEMKQEPKAGHWIETAEEYYKAVNEKGGGVNEDTEYFTDDIACSECLAKFSVIDNEAERFDFCPCCGSNNK